MKTNEAGFTIIELMIATAIFTVVLIITTAAIIGITETYIKGSVQGQTQQTTRAVLNDISQDLQFNPSGSVILTGMQQTNSNDVFFFCIGNDVYAYRLDYAVSSSDPSSNWALIRYSGSCPSSSPTPPTASYFYDELEISDGEELLGTNERLGELNITEPTVNNTISSNTYYTVDIEVAYGNDTSNSNSLLSDQYPQFNSLPAPNDNGTYEYQYSCKGGNDSSFCAVSTLTTSVTSRIVTNIE